ncbi:conjugal transfer protein TraI [Niabella sp. W65]|nr:conjugal transfer protein TraI [Niabella sp. W65]MCH7367264.1 conjugal transfer protein TraI [Niabella sp. W65]
MKKIWFITMLATMLLVVAPTQQSHAVVWVVVKAAVKKVIKAIDLQIQRLQNKTIWLQNAQKTLENTLSKLKLDEISDWTEKQKEQYRKYYEELAKVKSIISYYQRIRDITKKQLRLVDEYKRSWSLIRQDSHFTVEEIFYMEKVYSGILDESLKNIDQISLIIKSFTTKMSDAKRLELINNAADQVDVNYLDLVQFNRQNTLLSLQRAKTETEVQAVKNYMDFLKSERMKKILLFLLLVVSAGSNLQAQTFAEWFQQKKTQKKYLLQQIAALQVYIGYAKKATT